MSNNVLDSANWRVSSFTGNGGNGGGSCVEVALIGDDRIAVRNSNRPDEGVVFFNRKEMAAWIKGVKNSEFDDLT